MLLTPLLDLAAARHGVLTSTDAGALGYGRSKLRHLVERGLLVRTHPGIYRLAGGTPKFRTLACEALARCGPRSWLSHRSAAALWGLIPEPPVVGVGDAPPLELLRPTDAYRAHVGLLVRRSGLLAGDHVTVRDGMAVTSPARTLIDLTDVWGAQRLEKALDTALRRRLCTPLRLARLSDELRASGRRRPRVLETLVDTRIQSPPTDSQLEDMACELFARAGLPVPQRRVDLSDTQGRIGQVDLYFPAARLVIELDTGKWHGQRSDRRADAARDRRLERSGRRVLRFSWVDIVDRPDSVIGAVRDVLAARSPAAANPAA